MSSLAQIRDAIKSTLAMPGLHVYDTVADVVNVPAVVVMPYQSDYATAMAMGGDTYWFNLAVMVQRSGDTRDSQEQLDLYITGKGPKSIREHIFHNCDLGLDDVDAVVEGVPKDGYGGTFDTAGFNYVGALLRLRVIVT